MEQLGLMCMLHHVLLANYCWTLQLQTGLRGLFSGSFTSPDSGCHSCMLLPVDEKRPTHYPLPAAQLPHVSLLNCAAAAASPASTCMVRMLLSMLWHFVEMSMILSVPSIKSLCTHTAHEQAAASQTNQIWGEWAGTVAQQAAGPHAVPL